MVERCGYSDAVCLVSEQKFQAVLVDFDDPHSASLVLQNASGAENHPKTVALLSDKDKVRNVFGAGANFVLYKPLSAEQAETTLRATTALIKSERRSSFRVPIQVAVKLRLENGDGCAETEGILLDLSDEGMDVLAAQPLYPGGSLHARFTLPDSPAEFEILGDVAWANPNGESGVRFSGTPESVRAALRCWLRENSKPAAPVELDPVADCKLTDLSLGACYIETVAPFPERTHVMLTLRVEGVELQAQGLVRVMHPSRGMGIEFTGSAFEQRAQAENFIHVLSSRPGIEPRLLVSPNTSGLSPDTCTTQRGDVEDPLLDLLHHHESFSEEMFLEALRSQRNAEFVSR